MPKNVVEVKNLKKTYSPGKNPVRALRGVSFEVRRGEIFGLLGVNGAGKSTTLNILIGLLSPTSGRVEIFGADFFQHESELKQKMNIATAYADLAGEISVYENLLIYALLYKIPKPGEKINQLLKTFEISEVRNKRTFDLSAGQKTRVNLAKSLINDPELLLLDEPTASLDPTIAAHTRKLLLKLQAERKMTIVFTSHNMREVEQMCDRVAVIRKGRIFVVDTPENLQKKQKTQAVNLFLKKDHERLKKVLNQGGFRILEESENYIKVELKNQEYEISRLLNMLEKNSLDVADVSIEKADLEKIFIDLSREDKENV